MPPKKVVKLKTTTKQNAPRKQIDWDAVFCEYRKGQLSIVQIAKQFNITEGAIRYHSKKERWTKDLADQVRDGIRDELLQSNLRGSGDSTPSDAEIVKTGINQGVKIITIHRDDVVRVKNIVTTLREQLIEDIASRDILEEDILAATADPKYFKRQQHMMRAVALPTHISSVNALANALKTLIGLEREAYSLDAKDDPAKTTKKIDEIIITFRGGVEGG